MSKGVQLHSRGTYMERSVKSEPDNLSFALSFKAGGRIKRCKPD